MSERYGEKPAGLGIEHGLPSPSQFGKDSYLRTQRVQSVDEQRFA
ncbi:hypothetical protein [Glaciecola sp. SC05]